jgi:hypothetical protein
MQSKNAGQNQSGASQMERARIRAAASILEKGGRADGRYRNTRGRGARRFTR